MMATAGRMNGSRARSLNLFHNDDDDDDRHCDPDAADDDNGIDVHRDGAMAKKPKT